WAMLLFAALMMLLNLRLLLSHERLAACALLILSLLGACTVVLWLAFFGGISRRFPKARGILRKIPKGELLERSLDSCRQFGRQRVFILKAVLISMGLNAVGVLQVMAVAHGL